MNDSSLSKRTIFRQKRVHFSFLQSNSIFEHSRFFILLEKETFP